MTYLAIYFAIGILFSGSFDMGTPTNIVVGFLWPLALVWLLVMFAFSMGL